MDVKVEIDDAKVRQAFEKAPKVMRSTLDRYLNRAAMEMVRGAQDEIQANGSMFRSLLVQSMHSRTPAVLARDVLSGMHYAYYVEHGSKPGGAPPKDEAMEWLRIRHGVPKNELEHRAFLLRKHIFHHGMKAKPFMQPAFDKKSDRLTELIREGVYKGVAQVSA